LLQLKIVQNGTFEMTAEKGMTDNRPTCSLLESEGGYILSTWNVLIDLDHPIKDSSDLINSLASQGVTPEQINVVILTHLHPDHIGHKKLFTNALFMFHTEERLSFHFKNNHVFKLEDDGVYELSNDGWPQYVDSAPDLKKLENSIYIRHCPGHTKGSLAIFAYIDGLVYAFAGGIFLNKAYYEKWEPPGMSWKQERIYEHMAFIKENADVIVPGHGEPFST
jgi:glyoxylase-like metal-dependent hydrolase (beta-lactamase superfamily II)